MLEFKATVTFYNFNYNGYFQREFTIYGTCRKDAFIRAVLLAHEDKPKNCYIESVKISEV